jgi:hypothetical protein
MSAKYKVREKASPRSVLKVLAKMNLIRSEIIIDKAYDICHEHENSKLVLDVVIDYKSCQSSIQPVK